MFNHLEYFIAVAEELNFTKAAVRLNISQPPLSRQIKNLEEELGVILFHRSNQGVELTDAGKLFLERSYKIMNLIEKSVEDTKIAHLGEYGVLSIGFTGSITFFLIPLLKEFNIKYPKIRLRLFELNTPRQLKTFEDDIISIGFMCPPILNDQLKISVVNKQKFVLVLPANHALAQQVEPIALKHLKEDMFIVVPKDSGNTYHNLVMTIFRKNNFFPKNFLYANVSSSVISLVSEGLGVTIVPISLSNINIPGVVYKQIAHSEEVQLEIALVHKITENSSLTENFITFFSNSHVFNNESNNPFEN
ncbi:LysR family transcriptional regulator [Ornithinibacillus sp. 4-3]|uniref:LysR family transcriptional regulator n=1 Tax=Ornithinibacillus sp. 4-3 TaxID=3231488 RepID=A0AB39HQ52_9BACI